MTAALPTQGEPPGLVRAHIGMFLLVAGVVSWRQKAYFTGSIDPVVVLKGFVVLLALVLVLTIPRAVVWSRVRVSLLVLLTVYSVTTSLGGWASQYLFSSLILSLRLVLTAAVVVVLAVKFSGFEVFVMMRNSMLVLALVSVLTGSSATGRLAGGVPPLSPNELALLSGVFVISMAWGCLNGNGNVVHVATMVMLLGVVFLTGSRTGLALLIVALLVMVVQTRRIPVAAFVAAVAAVPAAFYVIGSTGVWSAFADRGGSGNVLTLSSRTIAWSAAFGRGGSFWQQLLGGGLSLKQIPVAGQYWNVQILDSTWISALVQGGYVGIVILVVWTISSFRAAGRASRPQRTLWMSLLVFVIGRSALESGMLDSSAAFIVLLVASIAASQDRRPDVASAGSAADPARQLLPTG